MGNTALGAATAAKALGFAMTGVVPQTIARAKDEKLRALGFSLGEVRKFIEAGEPTGELEAILANLSQRGLGEFVKVQLVKWTRMIKDAGIEPE